MGQVAPLVATALIGLLLSCATPLSSRLKNRSEPVALVPGSEIHVGVEGLPRRGTFL
jgi:hypothetical protein